MRSLRSFLLAEAKQKLVTEEDWEKLPKIKGGRLGNDLKDILKISKAAELKLGKNKETARCYKDPKGLLAELGIQKEKKFTEIMKSMTKSKGKLSEVFSGDISFGEYEKDNTAIAIIGLSGTGKKCVKGVSDGIRFFKFWIDSVVIASLGSDAKSVPLEYRRGGENIYVRYTKK